MMCPVLRELQAGVEALLPPTSLALVGGNNPTTLSPRAAAVAGELLQQQALPPAYPRTEASPGERRSPLDGMILTSRQPPRAGEINPKCLTAGAAVEGAIIQATGEKQKSARRAPQTPDGRVTQVV